MALEKPIIKAALAAVQTYQYKPREFEAKTTMEAQSFVNKDSFQSPDFKISDLVAQQAGISQLESDAHQDKINAQVLARLKDIQQKAYDEGYQLGLIEGTEKAFQEAKMDFVERLRTFEDLLKRTEELRAQLLVKNEGELIRLIFLIAKKMALRDLEGNRDAVREILHHVIGETQEDERVIVRLSPEDLRFLEGLQEKSGQRLELLQRVKFVPLETIKSGGCMIETEYGTVDATVEERVERTWQTLHSRIPQPAPTKKE